eukprot:gene6968-3343_t
MDPPQTAYPVRTEYSVFNVTQLLRAGSRPNVVAAELGSYKYGYMNVWCNVTARGAPGCRAFRLQLVAEMDDGGVETLVSRGGGAPARWVGRAGPLLYDHEYHGEIYDASRAAAGWDSEPQASFPGGTWSPALAVRPDALRVNDSALQPMRIPPMRKLEEFRAVRIEAKRAQPLNFSCAWPALGGMVTEGQFAPSALHLKCETGTIQKIEFANYGTPSLSWDCLNASRSQHCAGSNNSVAVVEKLCLGKAECSYNFSCPAPVLGGVVPEGQFTPSTLRIKCKTGTIRKIEFANYGMPFLSSGCTNWSKSQHCHGSDDSVAVVEKLCLGKTECSIPARSDTFGGDPCPGMLKRLVVVASGCDPGDNPQPPHRHQADGNVSWVFDFGQNMAGVTSLSLPQQAAAAGSEFFVRHGEALHEDGTCNNCGPYPGPDPGVFGGNCANMTNLYKVGGRGHAVEYAPRFAAAGFRYAELWGLPASFRPTAATLAAICDPALVARFVHTDVPPAGAVDLGAVAGAPGGTPDVLNRVQRIVLYAQRSNLWSIPTDCPQRERRGWLGDAHVSSNEAMLNHDMRAFYRHFLRLIRDDQRLGCGAAVGEGGGGCADPAAAAGSLPDVVPFTTGPYGGFPGSPVWQAAYPVLVRNLWRNYGDAGAVSEHYDGIEALLAYWARRADADGLVTFGGLGDWVDTEWPARTTPTAAVSSFYAALALEHMALFAAVLGRGADAARWRARHAAALKAYHARWWNASAHGGGGGYRSQTADVLALRLGAVPPPLRTAVVAGLVDDIVRARGNHTSSGIVGATHVFDVLTEAGRGDVGLAMLLRDDFPSYGYMLSQGATALWENWQGDALHPDGSWNHIMSQRGLPSAGWRHIVFRPLPAAVEQLRRALGAAAIAWRLDGPRRGGGGAGLALSVNVTVPAAACDAAWEATAQVVGGGGAALPELAAGGGAGVGVGPGETSLSAEYEAQRREQERLLEQTAQELAGKELEQGVPAPLEIAALKRELGQVRGQHGHLQSSLNSALSQGW